MLEVAAWEISHLGSCHFGNCHLGSRPWENEFGKVPNTFETTLTFPLKRNMYFVVIIFKYFYFYNKFVIKLGFNMKP